MPRPAGIDLPFPTRVVLFHDQTEETDGDRARQREGWPAGGSSPAARHLNEISVQQVNGSDGNLPQMANQALRETDDLLER